VSFDPGFDNELIEMASQAANGAKFKALWAGDTLVAEYKFKDSFEFTPYARLVFSANHPPRSADSSHAFFRRCRGQERSAAAARCCAAR
jgi:hypothetical protein